MVGRTIAQVTGAARFPSDLTAATCFRVDPKGKIIDTQYRLVSRESTYAKRDRADSAATQRRRRPRATSPLLLPGLVAESLARHRSGDYGQRSRGNTGAPTPIPFGVTNARRSSAICAVPASRKMIAAHAIACGDIKRKHSGGSHASRGRCPLLKRTAGGAGAETWSLSTVWPTPGAEQALWFGV